MRTSLAIAILLGAHAANAQTSLAHSQKLSIEIFADDPNWCSRAPTLRVVAPSAQAFSQPDVVELLQRVGTVVLAKLCPTAQEVRFTGTAGASLTPVWHGSATAARQWALLPPPVVTVNLDDPKPAPPVPTAAPPVTAAASPLLGEWIGPTGCNANDPAITTISVFSVSGAEAHAYVEVAPPRSQQQSGALRFRADGSFDAVSGQFTLQPGEVVRAGNQGAARALGTINGGAMALQTSCYNAPPATLTRQSAIPALAPRILADKQRRAEWLAALAARPRPGRLVGTLPPGEPRQPGCEELLAWAAAAPLDLRVRLLDSDGNGILRHYDDASSARVFGLAAYWWFKIEPDGRWRQTLDPSAVVRRGCTAADQRDPRYATLNRVAGDGISFNVMGERRQTDELVDQTPIRLATTGGPAAEMYRDLAALSQPATVAQGFAAAAHWSAQALNDANKAQLVAEATRLRTLLADRGLAATQAAIAAAPDTRDGVLAVGKAADQFAADFPDNAAPVQAAAATRRDAIFHAIADALTQATPATLDALESRRTEIAGLRTLTGGSPAGAALDAALAQSDAAALPAILAAETDRLRDAPPTVEGAQAMAARREQVLRLAGPAAPDQARAYLAAADARLAAIGQGVTPDLRTRLAALPAGWGSVRAAWDMAADTARPFGAAPVARDLRNVGNERVEAILASLADQAIAAIDARPAATLPQIAQLAAAGDAAAQPFQQNLLGRTQASRIQQAAQARANDQATAYFPAFRAAVAKAPMTHPAAQRLALVAAVMRRGVARVPAFGRYADLARDAALRIQGDACGQATSSLGLSAADAKLPMMLGSRVATLGVLACAFGNAGVVHGQFAPAGPDGDRALKLFVPAGHVDQVMQGAFHPGLADPPADDLGADRLLDFGAAAKADDGDILDVAVLVLRQVDVGVDRKALVAVATGDESQLRPLTVAQWRQLSDGLSAGPSGAAGSAGDLCAAFAADPDKLPPAVEARALLACPKKA